MDKSNPRFKANATIPPGANPEQRRSRNKVNVQTCPCCGKPRFNVDVFLGESGGQFFVCPQSKERVFISIY